MEKYSTTNHFLSLRDYENIAVRVVCKLGYKYRWMLRNEDAISEIIYNVALGDVRYKYGSRKGYRMSNANFSARTINSNKAKFVYLDASRDVGYGEFNLHKMIENKKDINPSEKSAANEIIAYIHEMEELTTQEKIALIMTYQDNASQSEIATHLQVSQQRISQYVESGIRKLKLKLNPDDDCLL